METSELELDPRLLNFAEQVRIRSGFPITVEDNKMVVGVAPNCVLLHVEKKDNRVCASFHRECHPLSVVTVLVTLLDTMEPSDLNFIGCFLSDVNGVLSYEDETGFNLVHIQYLRDLIGARYKNIFST